MSHFDQKMEAEDEKNMEELSFVPNAVSDPCTCLTSRAKGFKFFEIAVIVSEEGGAAHTIDLCRNCHN